MTRAIPGVTAAATTDLPVLLSHRALYAAPSEIGFSRWLASLPPWAPFMLVAVVVLWPLTAAAQGRGYTTADALDALWRWMPFLIFNGFVFTILISFMTMAIGTVLGVFLGLGQNSPNRLIARACWFVTQVFRNSPWLVILFIVMLSFPFEFEIGGLIIPVPDWMKAVIGFSLPVMANISEVVRGAVISLPSGQWESAESLAFTRRQTMWMIILPQCVKRMIPPWINWYCILAMATPIASIMGVEESVTYTNQALNAEGDRPELIPIFYSFLLAIHFIYTYPIARWSIQLEKRFAVKT